jgi:hypothetical protein
MVLLLVGGSAHLQTPQLKGIILIEFNLLEG